MDAEAKKRLYKWASTLVRLRSHKALTPDVVERLLKADLTRWHRLLIRHGLLDADADDPIPQHLLRHKKGLDFSRLAAVLRGEIPGRQGSVSDQRLREARSDFNNECQLVYWQWLKAVRWRAPLLILDEAHHAKNDSTQLAGLLRTEDSVRLMEGTGSGDKPLLYEKLDRMLFLTATPFQLGHQELIRVLRSFSSANWSTRAAPVQPREAFVAALDELEKRLDSNRVAGRRLDRLWGRLRPEQIVEAYRDESLSSAAAHWWSQVMAGAVDPLAREIIRAADDCKRTREAAQDAARPWESLRTWAIRHNRPTVLNHRPGQPPTPRREMRAGAAISDSAESLPSDRGLSITADHALPFLLAARAQGELAAGSSRARAFFAEGLCSSYEAFHHTRENRGDIRDMNDEGIESGKPAKPGMRLTSLIPVSWYEEHISELVPSKNASDEARGNHPKLSEVVKRVTNLWQEGEKVLVFCFYRQTALALRDHIAGAIDQAAINLAGKKLGLDPIRRRREIHQLLERIARRLADEESPFHEALISLLREPFGRLEFAPLREKREEFVSLLASYMRTPTFLARYLPLDQQQVRDALALGEGRPAVVRAGVEALRNAFAVQTDLSSLTMKNRVDGFLDFATDLAERSVGAADSRPNLLDEYVRALGAYDSSRAGNDDDGRPADAKSLTRSYRALPAVRMVFGDTKPEVRDRLMLAFNSPLFPEVLVSSAVLAEGVDLPRFCRHVIHHDLCWNPSTLEQRTGRVDRIGCKAEIAGRPIVVYEPYLAGSADEKMYRVVRDRERWFQIVMGQKFEMDEASSEKLAQRVPLPNELANDLVFDLRRYAPTARQSLRSDGSMFAIEPP